MIRVAALAILAGGVLLLVFGVNAMNSTSSDLSRLFTGSPSDRTIWMMVGGTAAVVAGLAGLLFSSKAR
jgi:Protein of unknown function (DUF3185)